MILGNSYKKKLDRKQLSFLQMREDRGLDQQHGGSTRVCCSCELEFVGDGLLCGAFTSHCFSKYRHVVEAENMLVKSTHF